MISFRIFESLLASAALFRNKHEAFLFTKDDLQICGIFDVINDIIEANFNEVSIVFDMTFIEYILFTYFSFFCLSNRRKKPNDTFRHGPEL